MKNTHICPKCNSADIIRIDGTYGMRNGDNVIRI